ncbi:MAG: hypothetical protein K0S41_175 [Anaerocolumna sp.]|nr:hypothetical protein [Anaerocolumna sp.]
MNKYYVKGSYTVEAAFVLPCIIFTIIALMYCSFYMHDKNKLQSVLDETLTKSKTLIQNETNMENGEMDYETYLSSGILYSLNPNYKNKENLIADYMNKRLKSGLFVSSVKDIFVKVRLNKLEINVTASVNIPFLEVKRYFTKSGFTVNLYNSTIIQNQADFIRIFDVFTGVTEKVDIVDQTLKKLQQILDSVK